MSSSSRVVTKPPHLLPPLPPAPSPLARYRLLSPTAGVHVSPLQLGGMSIGDQWAEIGLGSMDKRQSFAMLDAYYELGGNFIDTANNYQDGTSEAFIGEWAEQQGIRDKLFIATKYTNNYQMRDLADHKIMFTGNNAKSLHVSLRDSLKKLRTDYIDLLYLHWWDWHTGIEEVMRALHAVVMQGKVLYLGISDTPAWVVTKANAYARANGLTPFVIYQGHWNVMERSFERDIIPMARAEGMALAPWNVLAGGKFRTDAEEAFRVQSGEGGRTMTDTNWLRSDKEKRVSAGLERVAKEVGAGTITAIAIAYLLHKTPYVFPIIGGRKVEHLTANLEALRISLSKEQLEYLESLVPFDIGFPLSMIGDGTSYRNVWTSSGHLDRVSNPEVIRPVNQQGGDE